MFKKINTIFNYVFAISYNKKNCFNACVHISCILIKLGNQLNAMKKHLSQFLPIFSQGTPQVNLLKDIIPKILKSYELFICIDNYNISLF